MRTEITIGGCRRVFNSPEGVYLVGITVRRDGNNFSTIHFGDSGTDEEIMLDDSTTIIFHYYSMPFLEELMEEFKAFGGMKITEIREGDLYLFQTV